MTWMPAGHNDWFSVSTSESNFRLRFNAPAVQLYNNFDDAASIAAQLLYQRWGNRPLYLAMSGGIDSECVARILFENQIEFTPIIVKIGSANSLESWYAEYWCYQHNVTPIVLNYTAEQYTKEIARMAPLLRRIKNYNMTATLLVYEHAKNLGGHAIFGGGDINLDTHTRQFYCTSLDFISNLIAPDDHPTCFFMYTPELALSYINQFDIDQTEQYNKLKFYRVGARPKIDYVESIRFVEPYKSVFEKLFYLVDNEWVDLSKQKHWYGTKEQLVKDLQT